MEQVIINADGNYDQLDAWFVTQGVKCAMLVCGRSVAKQRINEYFINVPARSDVRIVRFSDYAPNPLYESVQKGVEIFRRECCDGIIAVGGGSAMDVAKCIKIYSKMDGDGSNGSFLKQEIPQNDIPFLAVPTTSGTGSEATKYAVIYYEGKKQSVTSTDFIPDTVLMDPSLLRSLPDYQKKATMMDALCHAIESFWSVNSTEQSKIYARKAIRGVVTNMKSYLANTDEGNAAMLIAANDAGKAINITQTTAGHAMCYKITSFFGCSHGHAAALCDRILYSWMIDNTDKCVDPRGGEYLKRTLDELGRALGCRDAAGGAKKLIRIFDSLGLEVPAASEEQIKEMVAEVNPVRLKNHPVGLDKETIDKLYHKILR